MVDVNVNEEVFNPVYIPQLENMARVQIMFGGSSSGKSKFKAQQAVIDVMRGGRNYLVCRQVKDTVLGSVSQEINRVITEWGLEELFDINKTDGTVTCINGYQIIYAGLDKVEKLKSKVTLKGAITDIWVEEATETERASIKQLMKRQRGGDDKTPKRLHLTFNPVLQSSWIYKDYFSGLGWADDQKEYISPDLTILKTTHKDNKFLTEEDHAGLENEDDDYFYQVYTLGNWGVLGDVIFKNWIVANLSDPMSEYYLPESQRTNRRNGLDFGFSSHPAAVGVSHYDRTRKRIYFYKELYETGLTNDILAERTKVMVGDDLVTCDSAEPKSVRELRNHGVNAVGAKKGPDSIRFGIDWLKQQVIIVDVSCINMQNELRQYHRKKDAGGNSLDEPVDKNNHLIDGGLRYAYEQDMEGENEIIVEPSPLAGYRG